VDGFKMEFQATKNKDNPRREIISMAESRNTFPNIAKVLKQQICFSESQIDSQSKTDCHQSRPSYNIQIRIFRNILYINDLKFKLF
jgi:hypothetical protein